MKLIKLSSRKYPGYECIVDDEDFEALSKYNWHPQILPKNGTIYAISTLNGTTINGKKTTYRMHRFVMQLHGHSIESKLIDHKDLNGLNNQKENIRICSHSQNGQNTKKCRVNKTAQYKGVCFKTGESKYYSTIHLNSKNIHLGSFDNEEDAARAYNNKAIELYGDFACLNIII